MLINGHIAGADDPGAVHSQVLNIRGEQIGHVPREMACALAPVMDRLSDGELRVEGHIPRGAGNMFSIPMRLLAGGRWTNTFLRPPGVPLLDALFFGGEIHLDLLMCSESCLRFAGFRPRLFWPFGTPTSWLGGKAATHLLLRSPWSSGSSQCTNWCRNPSARAAWVWQLE